MQVKNHFNQILVNRLMQRDVTALDYLYDQYSAALLGTIQRTLKNNQMAEEVLHDVFLKIWNQIEKFDPVKGTLFTWMYRIARNQAIDARRSRDFKTSVKSNDLDNYVNMFESPEGDENYIGLSQVIKKLGETCKKLIHLNFFMGYSHAEISDKEKIALGTVKTRIRNCLKSLKQSLKSLNREDVISQGYLEAYINEDLTAEDKLKVENLIKQDEEVRQEYFSIQYTLEKLMVNYGIKPSYVVKDILINEVSRENQFISTRGNGLKIMVAASVIVALSSLFTAFHFWDKWKNTEQELSLLMTQNLEMAQNFNQVNNELSTIREDLSVLISPEFSRIILAGTENAPTAQAVIYWNSDQGEVYLHSVSLQPLTTGQQYQLWALVDGIPIDAGVFDADASTFKEMKTVKQADTFAVTIEQQGGTTTPTLSTLQVIGNISS